MKKMILSFGLALMSLTTFAQDECKCFENTYPIVGDLTHEEGSNKYYAGIKDDVVVFTHIQYAGEKASQIYINSIPVANVDLTMNNMFASRSKTEDNEGYTELTLGASFSNKNNVAKYQWDKCYLNSTSMAYTEYGQLTAIGRFSDKLELVKLTDEIKALQGK